jgi:spermidine synthase
VQDRLKSYKLLHYKEGAVSTVTVEEYLPSGHLLLANNGKIDASSHVDMPTQELVAHLPILWYQCARGKPPSPPRDVVLIGLASGVTAGSVLQHDIKELHDVEIEPSMPQATRFFNEINHRPLEDPRMHLYINDARDFLTLAPKKFDVIIAEPSNPWVSGVSNLFTRDCFEIGKAALKDDGIYCQWVQFYSLNVRDVKVLMRTFNEVFKNVYVFGVPPNIGDQSPGPDLVVLGSQHPLRLDVAALRMAMRNERLMRDLERVNINNPGDLVALLRMGPDETQRYHKETRRSRGAGLINTDDNMHIEYAAPRSLYDETYSSNFDEITKFQADPTDERYLDRSHDRPQQARQLLDHVVARMILMDAKELAVKVRKKMEEIP